jgi:hypothetical protein
MLFSCCAQSVSSAACGSNAFAPRKAGALGPHKYLLFGKGASAASAMRFCERA